MNSSNSRSPVAHLRRRSRSNEGRLIKYGYSYKSSTSSHKNFSPYMNQSDKPTHLKWKLEEPLLDHDHDFQHINSISGYPYNYRNSFRPQSSRLENNNTSSLFRLDSFSTAAIDSGEMEDLMTFRTFVITKMDEQINPLAAINAYDQYKKLFEKQYTSRLFGSIKHMPVLQEKYSLDYKIMEFEEHSIKAGSEASQFITNLTSDQLSGLSLVEKRNVPRSVLKTDHPFILNFGQILAKEDVVEPLTPPYWLPVDPDLYCLVWKNVPPQVSKDDIKQTLTAAGAIEGLLDITFTVSENFYLSSRIETNKASYRNCWIKYNSDESCSSAELKLEGITCKRYTLRLSRRTPNIATYNIRISPSETCHPSRLQRDLILSAHLILKLDKDYGVLEFIAVNDQLNYSTFEEAIQLHPVLSDIHSVLSSSGRSLQEQLDLQLLYLRMVHFVCYYSGRRFSSYRELWETVGPLYLRPYVDYEEVINFFTNMNSTDEYPMIQYMKAEDIISSLNNDDTIKSEVEEYDILDDALIENHAHLMCDTSLSNYTFEPSNKLLVNPLDEHNILRQNTKIENPLENDIPIEPLNNLITNDDYDMQQVSQHSSMQNRGFDSPWLRVLDARIQRLLKEKITKTEPSNENFTLLQKKWTDFCESNILEIEEEKWRCLLCNKLFRGPEFVRKHLKNKHLNNLDAIHSKIKENIMRINFINDPFKPPITLPSPTPYLYRSVNLRPSHRMENIFGIHHGINNSANTRNRNIYFNSMIGTSKSMGQNAVKSFRRQYTDLDAPVNSTIFNKIGESNIRETVKYDGL